MFCESSGASETSVLFPSIPNSQTQLLVIHAFESKDLQFFVPKNLAIHKDQLFQPNAISLLPFQFHQFFHINQLSGCYFPQF